MADSRHIQWLQTARELDRAGEREQALDAYRRYLDAEPEGIEGWADCGGLLMQMGRLEEAREACARALELDPGCQVARINSACVLLRQGRLEAAEALLRQVLAQAPGRADAGLALAECRILQGDCGEARTLLEARLGACPEDLQAHQMLGQVLHRQGLWTDYRKELERRLALVHGCPYAEFEQGYLELLAGNLPAGWRGFEARLRVPGLIRPRRAFAQPRWTGTAFAGKTLLLHHEQGFGDTLMFVRFAPLVKALGGRVVLEVQPELADLVATGAGIDAVVAHGAELPPFDLQLPLMSLPLVLGIDRAGIPAGVPYLDIPEQVPNRDWIARLLAAAEHCTRVGLVWTGNAAFRNDAARSIPAEALGPLAGLRNVFFFGLQVDPAEKAPLPGFVPLGSWLSNFSDTAYALSGMDLVISVDTAVAHLAGALGIPTLLLLPHGPDWRWMLEREDSPWYPSMRIYRQATPGDWGEVLTRLAADLATP